MSNDSPAVIIYNEDGYAVSIILEDTVYKIETSAKLQAGSNLVGKVQIRNPGDTVDLGDGTNPIRNDPTGTTAQPVTDNGGSLTVDQSTAANLNAQVQGPAADGATPVGNPVLTAGFDGANVQTELTDTSGRQRVVGAVADGYAADGDPVQIAGVDDFGDIQSVLTETDGTVRVKNDFIDDRNKTVGVSFSKEGLTATTYYMGIDLSNTTDFRHTSGAGIHLIQSLGKAVKSNAGASWRVQLIVVLRIDGTDSDLAVLAQASVNLEDTSSLSVPEQIVNLWPYNLDLTVVSNEFSGVLTNIIETGVTAINTSTNLEDAAGNTTVNPAEGDLLIRADMLSGSGTLGFAYGLAYFVE